MDNRKKELSVYRLKQAEESLKALYKKQHKEKKVDLRKYMGRGEKMFQSDAQEYIKEIRDNDRVSIKMQLNSVKVI